MGQNLDSVFYVNVAVTVFYLAVLFFSSFIAVQGNLQRGKSQAIIFVCLYCQFCDCLRVISNKLVEANNLSNAVYQCFDLIFLYLFTLGMIGALLIHLTILAKLQNIKLNLFLFHPLLKDTDNKYVLKASLITLGIYVLLIVIDVIQVVTQEPVLNWISMVFNLMWSIYVVLILFFAAQKLSKMLNLQQITVHVAKYNMIMIGCVEAGVLVHIAIDIFYGLEMMYSYRLGETVLNIIYVCFGVSAILLIKQSSRLGYQLIENIDEQKEGVLTDDVKENGHDVKETMKVEKYVEMK